MKNLILALLLCHQSTVYASNSSVDDQLASMTLDQKIGQMLLIGFRGLEAPENSQIAQDIKNYHIGSVILFDQDVVTGSSERNIKNLSQVKKLNRQLQSYSQIPLFISIDQEGGRVQRLKSRHGFPSFPSHEKLGRSSTSETFKSSSDMGYELQQLNINLNFAPVVDVNVYKKNPIIGRYGRSFSQNPKKVVDHAQAFIDGHHTQGVATVIKHFPGHGSSRQDSHIGFTDISKTWTQAELIPFRDLIQNERVDMVMSAHVYHKGLDANLPATLSKNVIEKILREELKYDGVVISDDMNMGAIKDHYSLETSIPLAINAGVDILLFGNNLEYDKNIAKKSHDIIKKAVEQKTVSLERINQSVKRILHLKQARNLTR